MRLARTCIASTLHATRVAVFAATLAAVQNGASIEQPPAGRVTLEVSGREVVVKTYDVSGNGAPVGFHLLGACS
jgi:hypothetical protein